MSARMRGEMSGGIWDVKVTVVRFGFLTVARLDCKGKSYPHDIPMQVQRGGDRGTSQPARNIDDRSGGC
jgi:hypothetical protein